VGRHSRYADVARRTRARFESNAPKAVLFEGPPGTGKTTAARILAAQAGVPLVVVPFESVVSKWYGEAEKRLGQVFDACDELAAAVAADAADRAAAQAADCGGGGPDDGNEPPAGTAPSAAAAAASAAAASAAGVGGCIIFLDEVDSLATSRGGRSSMHEATRRMLGVLLRRIDGFGSQEAAAARDAQQGGSLHGAHAGAAAAGRSVVVCATNRKEDLDAALQSRFDLTVTFGLPDARTRAAILALYAKHLPAAARAALAGPPSEGCSGRDLKEACQATERRWASLRIRGVVVDGSGESEEDRRVPPAEEYARSLRQRRRQMRTPGLHSGGKQLSPSSDI